MQHLRSVYIPEIITLFAHSEDISELYDWRMRNLIK